MPLYIKDDATAGRVTEFAQKRGVSKQDARGSPGRPAGQIADKGISRRVFG